MDCIFKKQKEAGFFRPLFVWVTKALSDTELLEYPVQRLGSGGLPGYQSRAVHIFRLVNQLADAVVITVNGLQIIIPLAKY
jgi:hypothetical protein